MKFEDVKEILLEPTYNKLQLATALLMIVSLLKEAYGALIFITLLFLLFTYYSKKTKEK